MAIFMEAELNAQIAAWKQALLALSTNQEYSIGTRRLRRADLPEVRETLRFLDNEKNALEQSSGSRRVRTVPVGDSW